jgi:hypothetical protein
MTDNKIIKALKRVKEQYGVDCYVCKYKRICIDKICPFHACDHALDLINRQKAEIERLKAMNQAKLDMIHDIRARLEVVKSEAIKEFAEVVKNELHHLPTMSDEDGEYCYVCIESLESYINNLMNGFFVKEMTEE